MPTRSKVKTVNRKKTVNSKRAPKKKASSRRGSTRSKAPRRCMRAAKLEAKELGLKV